MSQQISLLDLPPELRILIYEHLIGPRGRVYISPKKRGTRIQIPRFFGWPGGGHGLLFVCRQIRNEFLPIYIESAVESAMEIVIPVKNFDFNPAQRFLEVYKDKFQPAADPSLPYGDRQEKAKKKYYPLLRRSLKKRLSTIAIPRKRPNHMILTPIPSRHQTTEKAKPTWLRAGNWLQVRRSSRDRRKRQNDTIRPHTEKERREELYEG